MLFINVKSIRPLLWVVLVLIVSACAGGPQEIPESMSAEELVQRAQEASDRNRYQIALVYYDTLLERNPTSSDWVCTAEYEIAFIHYKQKKYAEAREELNTLLERYESPDAELLPQQFKRLSQIVLESITEKEPKQKAPTAEG
jgi:outer membrane protein assembly factor BamD (BamD/ComL family)